MKAAILLVEGLTEEILYSTLLKRLYGAKQVGLEELPKTLRELVSPLGERINCFIRRNGYVILINCGGFEGLRVAMRHLLKRGELKEVVREFELHLVIAADKDKNPLESLRGLLSSMNAKVESVMGRILVTELLRGIKVRIHVLEQGVSGEGATGEIEDELGKLIEIGKPELQSAVRSVEEVLHTTLTSKQKLLIYLALLNPKIKTRLLSRALKEVLTEIDVDVIRHGLQDILKNLEEVLRT